MSEVSLSHLAGGLEQASRDICRHFAVDPNEYVDTVNFFCILRYTRWQLVAEQLTATIEANLPLDARREFRNLALKVVVPVGVTYH